MNGAGASNPGGLLWLSRDAATGEIEVQDGGGATAHCALGGDIDRLFRPGGESSGDVAIRLVAPDGTVRTLLARAVPGAAGLAVAADVAETDRRLAPVIETLVNQIAHDVRNYAFTVGLQAELGERRSEAAPEIKAHFAAVLRQVEALKGYLEQLLLYGRPVVLRPATIDPIALVRQQVQALRFSWRPDAPPLAVGVEASGAIGEVRWDPQSMGNALRAILDNAARSADPAPPVTVRLEQQDARVIVEVVDRGAGIPAEKLALLGSPMRVRRHGGAGLGLAISRKIVAAHGGTLELSTGPEGTTVRLELPREVPAG